MKIHITAIVLFILLAETVFAQRIRTDHREMTPGQKTAYLNAVNAVREAIFEMATEHADNFHTPIHSTSNGTANGKQFLPWHRVHQLEMEDMFRMAGTSHAEYITIPYWDWRVESTNATITWDDAGFLAISGLHSSFNLSARTNSGTLASASDITALLGLTGSILPSGNPTNANDDTPTSNFFSKRLEAWHNNGHGFVGGTMNGINSPRDPVFFLHHGFVDKLWQDWEEKDNAVQSVFDYTSLFVGDYDLINPNTIVDSRYSKMVMGSMIMEEDVWYAYNKKLLLDGLAGDFNVTGTGRIYSYTPWNSTTSLVEGTIYAGDVQRDASNNVIADTKGGFVIKSGADCIFKSGNEIRLASGFKSEQGSSFKAQIVSAPHGFSTPQGRQSNSIASTDQSDEVNDELNNAIRLYPNPIRNELNIEFTLKEETLVNVIIYDNVGKVVYNKTDLSPRAPGYYIERINSDNYPKGVYIVNLRINNFSKTIKVVK